VQSSNGLDEIRLYDPCHMTESEEARAALMAHKLACDEDRRQGKRLEIPRAVLGRAPEFASRMAMVLAILSQPEADIPSVGAEHVRVAIALADESARVFAGSLAANQRPNWDDPEAQAQYVLGAIRKAGGVVDWSSLLRSCQRLTARTMAEVVERLALEGRIVQESMAGDGRTAKLVRLLET